jgi:predicted metalloprotease with PDZ domain
MLALRERARVTPMPARDGFLAVLGERLGAAAVAEVEALAVGTRPSELPADLLPACLVVTTVEQPEFHRGFDIEATIANGRIVKGTDPALPAYAAGLRDGMRLVRREGGTDGDSRVPLTYHVEDAGTPRALTYRPEGHARIRLQEVSLAPDAPADCTRRLAGLPPP